MKTLTREEFSDDQLKDSQSLLDFINSLAAQFELAEKMDIPHEVTVFSPYFTFRVNLKEHSGYACPIDWRKNK